MPPKRSARIEAKNKRKMKEVTEEPSSAAASQQRLTMPVNFFPVQPHLQQLHQSTFSFNSQQKKQRPTEPDNLDKFITRPFTTFTALLTEEDVPAPLRRMYDHIDQVTKSHSGQVRNMLLDVYMRHYNSLSSIANNEAGKKLVEKEEELRQAKMKIMELEKKVNQLTYNGRKMQIKVRNLEMRCAVLDARLYAVAQSEKQQQQESVESSHVYPHVMEPVPPPSVGTCQACYKANTASIIWPCRHFCVCAPCAAIINTCPVCQTPKCTGS
ncbi:kinesin-like protein KIN-7M, chloroplastic [Solanum dulcamara]|uniref:kinesin-like protein KIN-7M, chloroplastic n=1 Tax=Solanum dulcamara TaxID=45834 RepID=UPI002485C084|nr:kinesin-like protein KIN-7M, chloroplastic [Solanum dulcamara]